MSNQIENQTVASVIPVGLNNEQLKLAAPSIFAKGPAEHVSGRYTFFSTADVLPILRDNGFVPTSAMQRKNGGLHARHRVELFREEDLVNPKMSDEIPRIILENSHDCSRRLVIMAGFYRMVCGNGLIIASGIHQELKAQHIRINPETVRETIRGITAMMDSAGQQVQVLKAKKLNPIEKATLAKYSLECRFRGRHQAPFEAKELLTVRRPDDEGNDLWTVFNRIQENVIKGGIECGSGRISRGVTSFADELSVNRRLWLGAEAMALGGIKAVQKLRAELN